MAETRGYLTVQDHSGEIATLSLPGAVITAANFDAWWAAWGALILDIQALTLGNPNAEGISHKVRLANTPASAPEAQREVKWLVVYEDTSTFRQYTCELPCADVTNADLFLGNTDEADLSDTDWADFITTFEAFVKSPAGNAVNVVKAYLVGRNT